MNNSINLFTIGFTQKTAQKFFETLVKSGVKRVIDTRLNNVSQLAGFTKKSDLEYFLQKIGNIEYTHIIELAQFLNYLKSIPDDSENLPF